MNFVRFEFKGTVTLVCKGHTENVMRYFFNDMQDMK